MFAGKIIFPGLSLISSRDCDTQVSSHFISGNKYAAVSKSAQPTVRAVKATCLQISSHPAPSRTVFPFSPKRFSCEELDDASLIAACEPRGLSDAKVSVVQHFWILDRMGEMKHITRKTQETKRHKTVQNATEAAQFVCALFCCTTEGPKWQAKP